MTASHTASAILINVYLASQPAEARTFSDILVLVDKATDDLASRVVTVTDAGQVQALEVAGDLSAGTSTLVQLMFQQFPRLNRIKLGYVDTVSPETWAEGYAACIAADEDVYGVCMLDRTVGNIAPVSNAIEAEGLRRLFVQSADSDWVDAGKPAAYDALATNERTAVLFHTTDGVGAVEAYTAAYLVFDPDEISATAARQVKGVTATSLTKAERDFVIGNDANLGGRLGSEPYFVMDGVSITGRPLYELTSADWLQARLQEAVANLRVERSAVGLKVPQNITGQLLVKGRLESVCQTGVTVGHFDDFNVTEQEITDADKTAKRLRFRIEAQIGSDTLYFNVDAYLGTDPLTTAEA